MRGNEQLAFFDVCINIFFGLTLLLLFVGLTALTREWQAWRNMPR